MSVLVQKMMYWGSRPVVGTYARAMLKMDVVAREPFAEGAKIIAPNHPSTTDPFFVSAMLRSQAFILINNVLFQVPIMGEYLRRSGHIPVIAGRGNEAVQAALEHLSAGHTIMIFPEGCLSPSAGGFARARTGVARLALLSGAPVYPVGIHLQWERIRTIRSVVRGQVEHGRWYLRGPYHISVGKPLHFKGDAENRPYVVSVAESIMHHIIELSHESEDRFRQAPGTLRGAFEAT